MRTLIRRAIRLLADERRFLQAFFILTTLALFAVCALKYAQFRYNAIDLAYFNQVLWNTVQGRPFAQSIHPHLSLGDHAEFILLLLAAPYALVRHPLTLLALQAAAVTAPVFLVHKLASTRYAGPVKAPFGAAPLFLAVAWLLNTSVHGMALFEFHALVFALIPLFFALLAYERGRLIPFLLWSLAAMLVREDVALVIAAVGLLAWIERRPLVWRITPLAFGVAYFMTVMAIIAHFAPAGAYKFAVYYGWIKTEPQRLLTHFFTLGNLEMALAFLMPVAFLPLLAPRRLVLLLGPLAQILLAAPGGSGTIAGTHYATLFLPAIFLASIDGLAKAPELAKKLERRFGGEEWRLVPALAVLVAATYSALVLGPLPHAVPALFDRDAWRRADAARDALRLIGPDDAVAAPYALLPALSSRASLYSVHYLFLGVTQFAERPYPAPKDLRFTVLDAGDFTEYASHMPETGWTAPHYADGRTRLSRAIGPETYASGPFSVHDLDARPFDEALREPIDDLDAAYRSDDGIIRFLRVSAAREPKSGTAHLRIDAALIAPERADLHVASIETFTADGKRVSQDERPLVALMPLPASGDRLDLAFDVRAPEFQKIASVRLTIVREKAQYTLDALRSSVRSVTHSEPLGTATVNLIAN